MTLEIITEPTAAANQLDDYNSSGMVKRTSYSPAAGTDWAVIGLILNDVVVPENEATLIAAIEALAGISSVADPRIWGQLPVSLLVNDGEATHECLLHTTSRLSCITGFTSNNFSQVVQQHATTKPELGKKWMVVNAVLLGPFADQAGVTALQTAITGINGITVAKVMVFGAVPDAAIQISLAIESRMRIDTIEA